MAREFRSKDKNVQGLIDLCVKQGWRMKHGGKKLLAFPPTGERPIPIPTTPGDRRAFQNTKALLRRAGLKV